MRGRRGNGRDSWRDWLWSALLGAGLALFCILWLGARRASPTPTGPAPAAEQSEARSLGFEFTLRFRVLLPKGGEE